MENDDHQINNYISTPPQSPIGTPPSSPISSISISDVTLSNKNKNQNQNDPRIPVILSNNNNIISSSHTSNSTNIISNSYINDTDISNSNTNTMDATPSQYSTAGHRTLLQDLDISQSISRNNLPRGDLGAFQYPFHTNINKKSKNDNKNDNKNKIVNNNKLTLPPPPLSPSPNHSLQNENNFAQENNNNNQFNINKNNDPNEIDYSEYDETMAKATVWGTDVNVSDVMGLYRQFIREFTPLSEKNKEINDKNENEKDQELNIPTDDDLMSSYVDKENQKLIDKDELSTKNSYYINILIEMHEEENYIFNLNCMHLLQYPPTEDLYDKLVNYPQILIRLLDIVVYEEYITLFGSENNNDNGPKGNKPNEVIKIQTRVYNLQKKHCMRSLDPSDIDQLISIQGMVSRVSSIIPQLREAFFYCSICNASNIVASDRHHIAEPSYCDSCNNASSFYLVHNRSLFHDKQVIKIQEMPHNIPEGETPVTVLLHVYDSLVDDVRPGDKIILTGVYRAVPIRLNPRQRIVKTVFKTYIDVVHFQILDSNSNNYYDNENDHENQLSNKEKELFRKIAKHPNVYEILSKSFAPSIWELDDVKKGILCQLFGGTNYSEKLKETQETDGDDDKENKILRSDINVLLCGDPGTSKSQLLSYVHKITARGIYTSGRGSSAVGLTASITRDPDAGNNNNNFVLESGALVLSDGGICCIDEFDKMSDSARAVLHEVMEQQTISVAKAGIICSLNARTSILASANPIESRYNPNKSVIENINILPTLLSRFDLIYLILDKPNQSTDRNLAKHIVSLYFTDYEKPVTEDNDNVNIMDGNDSIRLDMKMLRKYIIFAKKNFFPVINKEAGAELVQSYLSLRYAGNDMASNKKTISATPRQLEALIRLGEALAKMRFSNVVTKDHIIEALRLMNVATQKAAMDPRTGKIDMNMITTGYTALNKEKINHYIHIIKKIHKENNHSSGSSNFVIHLNELRKKIEEILSIEKENNTMDSLSGEGVELSHIQMALRNLEDENIVQVVHHMIHFNAVE